MTLRDRETGEPLTADALVKLRRGVVVCGEVAEVDPVTRQATGRMVLREFVVVNPD